MTELTWEEMYEIVWKERISPSMRKCMNDWDDFFEDTFYGVGREKSNDRADVGTTR